MGTYFKITIILKNRKRMEGIRCMNVDTVYHAQYEAWRLLAAKKMQEEVEYLFAKKLDAHDPDVLDYLSTK